MSSTPPEETPRYPAPGTVAGARMPIPGNAELAIFMLVWLVLVIIWAASDAVNSFTFSWLTVALTFGYMLSRGIAKASRCSSSSRIQVTSAGSGCSTCGVP